jgi:hypothetical protein
MRVFFTVLTMFLFKTGGPIFKNDLIFMIEAGLINSKSEIIKGTKIIFICGKVTEYIIQDIEVYHINNL